ncbi:MAG: elongation factor P [Candidatus Paceibacterota bacterium]
MLSINDLKSGSFVVIDENPFVVIEVKHLHMGRGGSSIQTKIKNLETGQVLSRNFKPADSFEEAEIEKMKSRFLYENRGVYWFDEIGNPKNRFSFKKEDLSEEIYNFLKPNLEIVALKFQEKVISIELPIKIDFKVVEAPPTIRGDTAQGGNKPVTIETGAKILVPLFIEEGDTIRINTQTGQYAERIEKA